MLHLFRIQLLIIFGATFVFPSLAQKKDSLEVISVHDNPDFSYLGLGPKLFTSLNLHNLTLLGVGFDTRLIQKDLYIKGQGRYHFFEAYAQRFYTEGTDQFSMYFHETSRDLTFDACFYFKHDYFHGKKFISATTSNNSSKVSKIDYTLTQRTGIGLGYRPMFTYFVFGERDLSAIRTIDNTEVTLEGVTSSYLTQHVVRLLFSQVTAYKLDAVIKSKSKHITNYGKGSFSHLYGGLLIGFNQEFDNVVEKLYNYNEYNSYNSDDYVYVRHDIQPNLTMSPIGAVIGFEHFLIKQGRFGSVSFNAEGGLMPGPLDVIKHNIFIDLSCSFLLGGVLKKKKKKSEKIESKVPYL